MKGRRYDLQFNANFFRLPVGDRNKQVLTMTAGMTKRPRTTATVARPIDLFYLVNVGSQTGRGTNGRREGGEC